jgi:hypothetical protein
MQVNSHKESSLLFLRTDRLRLDRRRLPRADWSGRERAGIEHCLLGPGGMSPQTLDTLRANLVSG